MSPATTTRGPDPLGQLREAYARVEAKHSKAGNDLYRARRMVSDAFDVLGDPATVELTVNRAMCQDGENRDPADGGTTLSARQADAVLAWENARARRKAYSYARARLSEALRKVEDR